MTLPLGDPSRPIVQPPDRNPLPFQPRPGPGDFGPTEASVTTGLNYGFGMYPRVEITS